VRSRVKRYLVFWGFLVAGAALAFAGWESYRSTMRFDEAAEARARSDGLVLAIDDTEKFLLDAETGQRGYLLTGEEAYLAPYRAAIKQLDRATARLSDFSSNSPDQQKRFQALEPLIETKLAELQRTIDLRRKEGFRAADAIVLEGSGKHSMDEIRAVVADMRNEEYELRRVRSVEMSEMAVRTRRIIVVGYVFGLLLLSSAFILLVNELSERKRIQEALEKSENWLSTTLGSIGDGVIAADMNGAVTFMNAVAQSLTGWTPDEARGKSMDLVFDIVNKETRKPVENPVKKVFREGRVVGLADHTILKAKNGTEFDIEDSAAPIRTGAGEGLGVVLVFRDITELQQTRQELDRYFSLSVDMLCIAGADGYFKRLNPAWQKALGFSVDELLARPYLDFVHPDDRRATIEQVEKQSRGEQVLSFENRYLSKDGSYKWLSWNATPVVDRGVIYALARDITELKRAQTALRLSEERYRLLFESNPHPAWVHDLETLAILDVNAAATRNYGYSREDFLGLTIEDIRPPEDVPEVLEGVEKSAFGVVLENGTCLHRKRDGTLFYVEVTSHPLAYAGRNARLVVATDITKRKQAEGALRQSEERFRLLLSGVRDYAIFMLDPAGRVASWNLGAQGIKGYQESEIIGQPFSVFYTPEDIAANKPSEELRIAAAKGRTEDEGWRVRKDGSRFWANVVITALRDEQGQLRGFAKITRDITGRRETEEALVRAKEEAERSNRFKDQFLSTMSHELRTPLNAVLGFSELLVEERYGPLNDRQRRYLNHIHVGGSHLLRLINDILDLSKIEAGRLQLAIENVPVKSSFAEVVDTLRPLAEKKSQTLACSPSTALSVRADATRFKQILMNLLGNAIKFTPEAGKIELRARDLGELIRVEVSDSGPGIPAEEQQKIFEAFHRLQQSEKSSEGTGLGLAITRRLVELQGGQLGVESEPGSGSCFYFTLPLVPTVVPNEVQTVAAQSHTDRPARILVIEDDLAAAHLLESQLTSAGYDVVVCEQPSRAVDFAAQIQPSAVTLDIVMKPINGWELLANLKSDPRTARIPVIVVSVVDQPSTGALLGADEYIVKPVEKALLLSALERCLRRSAGTGGKPRILVVEDDAPTREFIAEFLSQHGYVMSAAVDGVDARAHVAASLPSLVILDLILPQVSGFELLSEWRRNSRTADLPVFVLTSKDLSLEEKAYLHANAGALFSKTEPWHDGLLRQVRRAVASGVGEKS
jgi:PAS domain S-box-containing protein